MNLVFHVTECGYPCASVSGCRRVFLFIYIKQFFLEVDPSSVQPVHNQKRDSHYRYRSSVLSSSPSENTLARLAPLDSFFLHIFQASSSSSSLLSVCSFRIYRYWRKKSPNCAPDNLTKGSDPACEVLSFKSGETRNSPEVFQYSVMIISFFVIYLRGTTEKPNTK